MNDYPPIYDITRPYHTTGSCPATIHLGKLVAQANAEGMCPQLPPTERQVADKLLVQGIAIEDVLKLTVRDIKSSVGRWMALRKKNGPSPAGYAWSPAWLKHCIMERQQEEWAAKKKAAQRESDNMPAPVVDLAAQIGHLPEDEQRDFLWGRLHPMDRKRRIDSVHERLGVKVLREIAMTTARGEWWRERKEQSDD